jgi:CelD/BcsL family acetyltransferase involved in cellulose biosynthesis
MTVIDLPSRTAASSVAKTAASLSVATTFASVGLSRQAWDDLVLDSGGDIYTSYDWCRIWWRHYGANRSLRLFTIRQHGKLVGIVPMFIERIGLAPFAIRVAKPVGSDFAMDVFGFPALAGSMDLVCSEVVFHLMTVDRCDAVWSGFAPASHDALGSLRRLADATDGIAAIARDVKAGVLTAFDLPDDFNAYVAGLGKAARQNVRRQSNLLKNAGEVTQTVVCSPADPGAAFHDFAEMHTTQWEAEGLPGHFNDWPRSSAFNAELMARFAELGRLRMVDLSFQQKPVASQYAFTFGPKGYWRLAARVMDKELGRYGLGVLGLMQLLERMCSEGVRLVEGGYGRYPYKLQYGAKEYGVTSLLLSSTRPLSRLRTHIFVALSEAINLSYYRIWRLRIAPRLRRRGAPLWRNWIRFRM